MAKTSAISMIPALMAWTSSPMPGTSTTTVTCARPAISTSSWPTPTVSMMTKSLPAQSMSRTRSAVARASPPTDPRVAMERMNMPGSAWCCCMRMRSPKIAPPVMRLVGSIARMATVFPWLRRAVASASTSVLLPAPGGPVIPTMRACPANSSNSRSVSSACGSRFSMPVAARASARASPSRILRAREFIRLLSLRFCLLFCLLSSDFCLLNPAGISRAKPLLLTFQKLPCDHQTLNLAGAFPDGAQLHVAIKLLHRVILDEAVAAVDLHGLAGDAHRRLGSEQLGHGGFARQALAAVEHPGRAVIQQARGIQIDRHIDQFVLDGLKLRDGPRELLAQLGIAERGVVRALRHADGKRGNRNAAAVEHLQAVDKAIVPLTQELLRRQAAIFENHFAGGAGAQPQLVFLFAQTEPRRAFVHDKSGNAVLGGGAVGDGHGHANVGVVRVGEIGRAS